MTQKGPWGQLFPNWGTQLGSWGGGGMLENCCEQSVSYNIYSDALKHYCITLLPMLDNTT